MTAIHQLVMVFVVTILPGCSRKSGSTTKSSKTETVINDSNTTSLVDTPRSFVKNYGANDNNHLFAFVGEKISVEALPNKQLSMNFTYKAKYLILKKVYGRFLEDTIEFVAFDHYGIPAFSKFKNVLLYVSADSGMYYHQKYLYNDVYRTKEGQWAGTYAGEDFHHGYNKYTKIKPIKIDFAEKVIYPIKMVNNEGLQIILSFPRPFFKTVGDSAFAIYGNYIDDLFELKKSGYLTARGLFKATVEQEEAMVEAMQPEASKKPPSKDDSTFLAFWKIFISSLKESGLENFKRIALDSLIVCDNKLATNNFIFKCFNEVIDDEVQKRIFDRTKLEYSTDEIEFSHLMTASAKKEIIRVRNGYRLRQMSVTRSTKNNNPPTIRFDFIETKKGFRLYGIDHHWFKECCK